MGLRLAELERRQRARPPGERVVRRPPVERAQKVRLDAGRTREVTFTLSAGDF